MTAKIEKKEVLETLRTNEKKWTKPLMDSGWLAFPSIILEKQHALGLTPMDINIILYLATYWWTADNKPHPSKTTIAEALDVTPRTIQRRIAVMEKLGFIRREERRTKEGSKTNCYHFDGLIKEVTPFAIEKIEVKKKRKEEDDSRRLKKRPALRVVPSKSGKEGL
ncbi:Helix-turn-helix domain-containing protein [Nitrosospira sp. Nsp1]|nr:Helix-turn-helix domain-containing protein [Nitrosospira sp. Nsp1]